MLVVFDMDGTLIDSGAEITARVQKAFAAVGLAPPIEEVIRGNVGLSLPIYLSAVSGSDDPELIAALLAAYRAASAASLPGRMPMFVGARELFGRCECKSGCLACVGPVLTMHEEAATSPKGLAMSVLSALEAA